MFVLVVLFAPCGVSGPVRSLVFPLYDMARVPSLKSRPIRSRGAATTGGLDVRTVGGGHLALLPPCSDLLPANLAVALGTCLALRLLWFTEFLARYHAFV